MRFRLQALAWVSVVCGGCYGGHTQSAGDPAAMQDDGTSVAPDGTRIGPDGQPVGDSDPTRDAAGTGDRATDGMGAGSDPGTAIDPATGLAGSGAGGGAPDVCFLPPDSGPCEAAIPRFYYEPATGSCERFVYGGCEGNENNFESLDVCVQKCGTWQGDPTNGCPSPERQCASLCAGLMLELPPNCPWTDCGCGTMPPTPLPPPPAPGDGWLCSLPPEPGPCDGSFERYYFDPQLGTCASFVYGGCGGNANNFDDLMFCLATCSGSNAGQPANPCDLGKELGPDVMCDGVVAGRRCFGDPYAACACLGCAVESCAVTLGYPQTAVCL